MTLSRYVPRLATLAVAGCLLTLPACMKVGETLNLAKDGTGTVSMKVVADLGKMNEIMEMFKGMMGGEEGGDNEMKKEFEEKTSVEDLKKKLEGKKGVELVSATPIDDAEKKLKGMDAKIKFATLEDFYRAGLEENVDVQLEDLGGGTWKLTRRMLMQGMGEGEEMPEEAKAQMEMVKGMLEPYMGEMEMSMTLTVPGTIVETNGTKGENGTITWKLGFEGLLDPKNHKQFVTFKGEGLTLKPFHLRLNDDGKAEEGKAPATTETPKEPAPAPAPEGMPK